MPLYQVAPRELPELWPIAAPMLQKAIDVEPDFITIEQAENFIRTGKAHLLVWEEPDVGVTGAAMVEFLDYPRERVAHISLTGGKGIANPLVFDEVKNWMRLYGATKAQCWTKGALVRVYEKIGFENTQQVMRIKL
jgi:hypothetical protein